MKKNQIIIYDLSVNYIKLFQQKKSALFYIGFYQFAPYPNVTQCCGDRKLIPEELCNIFGCCHLRNYSDVVMASKRGNLTVRGLSPLTLGYFTTISNIQRGNKSPAQPISFNASTCKSYMEIVVPKAATAMS